MVADWQQGPVEAFERSVARDTSAILAIREDARLSEDDCLEHFIL